MKNLFFLSFLLLIFSCGNTTGDVVDAAPITPTDKPSEVTETPTTSITDVETEAGESFNMQDLQGYYVGMFDVLEMGSGKSPTWSNKINISIDSIDGEGVIGHSVVAGNDRPFMGTIKSYQPGEYYVEAQEPGDDKYDGTFKFTILLKDNTIVGKWYANDKNLSVKSRKYELEKKDFKYNPAFDLEGWSYTDLYNTYDEETGESEILTNGVYSKNPSTEKLTKADLENLFQGDLEVMRNTIYAKHGYSFKNRRMRYVFNHVDWYIPVHTDIRSQLTDLEKENIELIKRYENHAEKYYDHFGR